MQKITFTNAERLSNPFPVHASAGTLPELPVNAGAEFVPAGVKAAVPFVPVAVSVWVCVARADPVKICAATVLEEPVNVGAACVGTPAGHATVPAGVKAAVPFVPVAVRVCV